MFSEVDRKTREMYESTLEMQREMESRSSEYMRRCGYCAEMAVSSVKDES